MLAPLRDNLLRLGFTAEDLAKAEATATEQKQALLHVLDKTEKAPPGKVIEAFGAAYRMPIANLSERDIPQNIIDLIPKEIATKYRVIPIERAANNIILAMANPFDVEDIKIISFKTGSNLRPVLASEAQVSDALVKYYGKGLDINNLKKSDIVITKAHQEDLRQEIGVESDKSEGPVIQIVNDAFTQCLSRGASDIHIEPFEKLVRIRLRIDGDLVELYKVPLEYKAMLITRVKILSKLDITETRKPQDGNIRMSIGGKPVDFRVSSVPTTHGEKIVMRILDKSALQVNMTKLGFDEVDLNRFKECIHAPFGMVLVTGPTGSGKTTTLYSALGDLNKMDTNIMTAEDPVEYTMDGINQVHVKSEHGMTFALALKAFLRQDPDVIMVGEIRDLETAEIAVKAALTGHLLLSTVHTNSAPETISRLLNMGVEPFNLVAALSCVVAQRLLRKICDKCKVVDDQVTPRVLQDLGVPEEYAGQLKAFKGKGCPNCRQSGNRGRVGIHEVLVLNDPIRRAILDRKSALDIKILAMEAGMKTLRQSALIKMTQGLVSAEEVISMTISDSQKQETDTDIAV